MGLAFEPDMGRFDCAIGAEHLDSKSVLNPFPHDRGHGVGSVHENARNGGRRPMLPDVREQGIQVGAI